MSFDMAESKASTRPSELAHYGDLFERMLDPLFLIDPDSFTILDSNVACERVLGLVPEDIEGKSIEEWVNEDNKGAFNKELRITRRRYHPRRFDSRWSTKDGRTVIMEVVACMMQLSDDSAVLQIIAKDVTRARESEKKAAEYLDQLEAANRQLEKLSQTDPLTGLSNMRNFKNQLAMEFERATRYGPPFSIVFFDLDHFKNYNDTNGHPAGDAVLKKFAEIVKYHCRKSDTPARYGGEEFVILCRGVSWEGAQVLAERVRQGVEAFKFPHGEKQPLGKVTVSVGVSSYMNKGESIETVMQSADEALYYSKEHGRNKVTTSVELATFKKTAEIEKAS